MTLVSEDCTLEELKPQSPYATTKLKEETVGAVAGEETAACGRSCSASARFSAPRAGMRYHTAVNKFCWQAVMKQPLSIWHSAYDQKRPYLDLVDAIRAIAFVIKAGPVRRPRL